MIVGAHAAGHLPAEERRGQVKGGQVVGVSAGGSKAWLQRPRMPSRNFSRSSGVIRSHRSIMR